MAHTMTVLALARSTTGFYFGELLAGMTREVARAGGRVVVVQTLDPGDVADDIVEVPSFALPVAWDAVDGAVAISLAAGGPYLTALERHGVPVVVASAEVDGFRGPVALPDNHGGTRAALQHLRDHGHARIGFVGNLVHSDIRERYDTFRAVMADAHSRSEGLLLQAPDNAETGGRAAADAFARLTDRPTALMAATDRNALGLMDGLARHGVRVPEDVAVIGFDNVEAGAFSQPPLTTVDQRFDEVGALAGRMVVAAVRGETVRSQPTSSALIATRESCGCTGPLARDVLVPDATTPVVLRRATDLLDGATAPHGSFPGLAPDVTDRVTAAVSRVLTAEAPPSPPEVRGLLDTLRLLRPRPDVLHRLTDALIDNVDRAPWARGRGPAGGAREETAAGSVVAALWRLQAETYLRRSQSQEVLLAEQFSLATGLLDAGGRDPRALNWLTGSHVRVGLLATWVGDPSDGLLEVVGSYDPTGVLPPTLGSVVEVRHFPPHDLAGLSDPGAREACFVVPVRTRDRDWGLLVVVGAIDTTSSRDIYLHWAQLLCAAFEGEELEQAVRASEERYAHAARAANDGLWEWDSRTGEVYASERCRALTGMPATGTLRLSDWERNVRADDLRRVRSAMAEALADAGSPVEIEYRVRTPDGERWVLARGLGVRDRGAAQCGQGDRQGDGQWDGQWDGHGDGHGDGRPEGHATRLVGSLSDIHQRKELEEQLRRGALYDELTGLPNRRLFLERLRWALAHSRRDRRAGFAVVFLDLDGFKLINDSLGHLTGDRLLTEVGERLRTVVRSVDTAARFGGDEFALLLTDLPPEEVLVVVERVQEAIAAPVGLGDQDVSITASVGITTSDTLYADAEDVLRDADTAMYHAKSAERGSSAVFDPTMHARASGRLRARGELRQALAERQFVVHYQPIVDIDDAVVDHFEALVRWQHPERGLLAPGAFLAEMEEHGTVVPLGVWLVDEVCRQIAAWRAETGRDVTVSVNVSHKEFWNAGLLPSLRAALGRHGVQATSVVLEITESVVMAEPDRARALMAELRSLGLRLHLDDFGTGQSSLHALRSFPVDALKIDGSFVRELGDVAQTSELVGIILAMGRALGLEVVAEGVETVDQAERLRAMGCRTAQGWLYARALPPQEAGALLGRSLSAAALLDAPG